MHPSLGPGTNAVALAGSVFGGWRALKQTDLPTNLPRPTVLTLVSRPHQASLTLIALPSPALFKTPIHWCGFEGTRHETVLLFAQRTHPSHRTTQLTRKCSSNSYRLQVDMLCDLTPTSSAPSVSVSLIVSMPHLYSGQPNLHHKRHIPPPVHRDPQLYSGNVVSSSQSSFKNSKTCPEQHTCCANNNEKGDLLQAQQSLGP